MARATLIGIDVGGTFTDAVVFSPDDGRVLSAFKLPSSPADPAQAVLAALDRIASDAGIDQATVCHGTTVGTNALLERKGSRTALLATRGFTDIIELRRQDRPTLYDLTVRISEPLVPPERRLAIDERVDAEGRPIEALGDVDPVLHQIQAIAPEAVAIALLHSYANGDHETALADRLRQAYPDAFVSVSSDVCPELGEFERTSTTVVNAYIGPAVSRYLERLSVDTNRLGIARLLIVKSNGGLSSAENAARYPVHLIESGPAAGMIAAAAFATATHRKNLITFDMGGTTAKAGVVRNGELQVTGEFRADAVEQGRNVGGYPIRSAVVELVEIGAGGGSLAWIDAGGVLKVGPQSAGADPGPACYGRGGTRPTVTDAHAVIGTLNAGDFAQTGIAFSRERAERAIREHVAKPMGWSLARAAHGIISLAVASMTEMVRLATVRKGLDPRVFTLLASGGAGPLHACLVGREVGVEEVVVPPYPGMFSAIGATLGNVRHDLSRTLLAPIASIDPDRLSSAFVALRERAQALLEAEGVHDLPVRLLRHAELRFAGQLFELRVALGGLDEALPAPTEIESLFRQAYLAEFGIELPRASVQLVRLGLVAQGDLASPAARLFNSDPAQPTAIQPFEMRELLNADGSSDRVPAYRAVDSAGLTTRGPALFAQAGATVWVPEGLRAEVGHDGCLMLRLERS